MERRKPPLNARVGHQDGGAGEARRTEGVLEISTWSLGLEHRPNT